MRNAASALSDGPDVASAAVFLLEMARPRPPWRRMAGAVTTVAADVLASAGLAAVQKRIYPDSVPFYARGSFSEEPSYVQIPRGAAAVERLVQAEDVVARQAVGMAPGADLAVLHGQRRALVGAAAVHRVNAIAAAPDAR